MLFAKLPVQICEKLTLMIIIYIYESERELDAKKDQCRLMIEKKWRQAANNRERKRVRAINEAFLCLQNKLPKVNNKKISKMGTLTSAVEYIRFLLKQLSSSRIGTSEGLMLKNVLMGTLYFFSN